MILVESCGQRGIQKGLGLVRYRFPLISNTRDLFLCFLGSIRLRQVFAFLELRSEAFSVFLPLLQARLCLVSVVGLDGREFCPPSGVGDLWYHGGILDPDSFPASPQTMRQMNFAWGSGRFSSLGSEDKRFAPASSVS